ncbi:sensor histidine kinase [Paracoccus pacificus]|uniref:histidine kinase n=1 Tax=Paracoccus pacificus TaxID=1463598 RepID=A0ABW4R4F7_9RHOB
MAERLRTYLDAVPMAVIIVDETERVANANRAAETAFAAGADLTGRPFVTVLRQPALFSAVEEILASPVVTAQTPGAAQRVIQIELPADGRPTLFEVTVTRIADGAMLAFADQTSQGQAEQIRREFVSNVTHELRTPLTALMGFIETLRGPARNDAEARERFLNIMEREAGRMNRLVGDLLSLSRVESGERKRPSQTVDIVQICRQALETITPSARDAGVRLELDADKTVQAKVSGDSDQLVQVFNNLIENAVKYGGAGGLVRIQVRPVAHEPVLRGPAWQVDVIDQGEGIEALHLPRLTERFYRVDSHRSRKEGGTGLGLAIVKHIINRHRGRLRIESEIGKGSRFSVFLPQAPVN